MTRVAVLPLVYLLASPACREEPVEKKEMKWLPVERAPEPPVAAADAAPVRPAAVSPQEIEAAEAVRAWFKTLAAAARGSASDCIAMARAIESVGAKGRPIVARAKELQESEKDPAAAEWLEAYLRENMDAGYNELVSAMGPCAENATVRKAMKAIAR
ncbi:MAG TPA: hypothetical protein VFU21_22300 [Kofleriaceae bacterium]|nr:hypothetical protein [Kofleriaceae bacterium]